VIDVRNNADVANFAEIYGRSSGCHGHERLPVARKFQ
jgi:hypothetical protein